MQKHTQVKEKRKEESLLLSFVFFLFFFHLTARKKNEFLMLCPVDMPCTYIQQKRKKKKERKRTSFRAHVGKKRKKMRDRECRKSISCPNGRYTVLHDSLFSLFQKIYTFRCPCRLFIKDN